MKNTFDAMQVFEKFRQFAKKRIRVNRYENTGQKKKKLSAWPLAVRRETEKGTIFHITALFPGMIKPLVSTIAYKDLLIEDEKTKAPDNTFESEFGLRQEQYTIDKSTNNDLLLSVCAEKKTMVS